MYFFVILLFLFGIIIYLSTDEINFSSLPYTKNDVLQSDNYTLIEFLTKDLQRVKKNYSNSPQNFISSRYNVSGYIENNSHAILNYAFPLINRYVSNFKIQLKPLNISNLIDEYGVSSSYISSSGDGISYVIPEKNTPEYTNFQLELEKGKWYINHEEIPTVDYKKVTQINQDFCSEISSHIYSELQHNSSDSYYNRVQAVLNFVQHIPYGIPSFDTDTFTYFGVALPPESFVLNYSDCDSKSIFFASILLNLIDLQNIILVRCVTTENHMMVAVKGLNINAGKHVNFEGEEFLLLETTTPSVIGEWHWENFELKEIIKLAS